MTAPDAPIITVVGSVNMDLVVTTATLPVPGETVRGQEFRTVCGGKGANQAIAASRAGGQVRMVGAVGTDAFGDTLAGNLQSNGVDAAAVRRVAGSSGVASIMVDRAAENVIVVVAGANGTVTDLTAAELELVTSADLSIGQLEIPIETVTAAALAASAAGKTFLLNPSPVQPLPADLLGAVTILVLNEGEAQAIGADAIAAVPHVVTTLGGRGARYRGPDGATVEVPAPRVQPVDTTGAGDAFTGALAVAWAHGWPPLAALRWACAAGALATTTAGADSSPRRPEIEHEVARSYPAAD